MHASYLNSLNKRGFCLMHASYHRCFSPWFYCKRCQFAKRQCQMYWCDWCPGLQSDREGLSVWLHNPNIGRHTGRLLWIMH